MLTLFQKKQNNVLLLIPSSITNLKDLFHVSNVIVNQN